MIPYQIIKKKRNGAELDDSEIKEFIGAYVKEEVTDYQMAAFLMTVFFRGMSVRETATLTRVMVESGERCDFSDIPTSRVDKHSTGGLGDKTSFILAPICASLGVTVPMISGRGLGHTGGTLDKYESIPGIKVDLGLAEFQRIVREHKLAIVGQTKNLCPADKRLYALRDVTGTVECIPLITSSILCKKYAEDIQGLVMDVKVGSGAFMKNMKDALELTKSIARIGKKLGLRVTVLITDMNQPLGTCVGNSLEISEVMEVLSGKGPKDTIELSVQLAAQMVLLARRARNLKDAERLCQQALTDGSALAKFKEMVAAQGGRVSALESEGGLPLAAKVHSFRAASSGYVFSMNTEDVGMAVVDLGGGRKKTDDRIDHGVGLVFKSKIGDAVKEGDEIVRVYYEDESRLAVAVERLGRAITVKRKKPPTIKLIHKVVNA